MIYFTSDLHFQHNKEFLYKSRGFNSINEHDQTIINNWNNIVNDNDDVYILGDLMLGNIEFAIKELSQLKGKIHIIIGNHDTNNYINKYKLLLKNVVDINYVVILKYNGFKFYLSHYPTITTTLITCKDLLSQNLINLYGHTHQKNNFYKDNLFMYHVGLDSHDNKLISIDEIIKEIKMNFIKN